MKNYDYSPSKFKACSYSERLLDKIVLLNQNTKDKVDISEVKKAVYYARKYHGNQMRESGEPYYSHPIEVAYIISDCLFRTDIIVTSILHDTVEDTELTFNIIEKVFGPIVSSQVEDLTRIKRDRKITSAEMTESLWFQKKYDVLLIKQCDRLHNMRTLGAKSPEKAMKIVQETIKWFLPLSAFFEIPNVEEELYQLCLKQYSSVNAN